MARPTSRQGTASAPPAEDSFQLGLEVSCSNERVQCDSRSQSSLIQIATDLLYNKDLMSLLQLGAAGHASSNQVGHGVELKIVTVAEVRYTQDSISQYIFYQYRAIFACFLQLCNPHSGTDHLYLVEYLQVVISVRLHNLRLRRDW